MISLATAKKLKEDGLQHIPEVGDWYQFGNQAPMLVAFQSMLEAQYTKITNTKDEHYPNSRLMTCAEILEEGWIWLPRLDQLLAEIERRGYKWQIHQLWNAKDGLYQVTIYWNICEYQYHSHIGDPTKSLEDAAADALIWILEQHTENA